MFVIIAARGINNEIGKNNSLIWHLPKDLKFFKQLTTGHKIVMGRKTFESLPKKLPNREHFVVTSKSPDSFDADINIVSDIDKFIADNINSSEKIFVIGGGSIYNKFIDVAKVLYLTEINDVSDDADTFFPNFNESEYIIELIDYQSENGIYYEHIKYMKN